MPPSLNHLNSMYLSRRYVDAAELLNVVVVAAVVAYVVDVFAVVVGDVVDWYNVVY